MDWSNLTWARGVLLLLFTSLLILYWYIRIPGDMPRNIPKVPIYISLLGLWSDMGQDTIYDRWLRPPLEKHGAVKIWFAGRWNVLATRPQFLVDMFRHEDIYAKAGSQKKIPWSVIASLVGDNIINAHGTNWKLYTSIMKPGLQRRIIDSGHLLEKSRLFVDILLEEQEKIGRKSGVLANPIIQRWALSCMGISFMNVDLKVFTSPCVMNWLTLKGTRDTRSASRTTPDNHQEDTIQTTLLQLPRPRPLPISLPATQRSLRHHARIRRPPRGDRTQSTQSSTQDRETSCRRPRPRTSSRPPGPRPRRRQNNNGTIPCKPQSNLPNSTRERTTTPQLHDLHSRGERIHPKQTPHRDPLHTHQQPNHGSHQLPPIPVLGNSRTSSTIPASLPTHQPGHNPAHSTRRNNPDPESYVGRVECIRGTHRLVSVGIGREGIQA